jgi:hypothetical protein
MIRIGGALALMILVPPAAFALLVLVGRTWLAVWLLSKVSEASMRALG